MIIAPASQPPIQTSSGSSESTMVLTVKPDSLTLHKKLQRSFQNGALPVPAGHGDTRAGKPVQQQKQGTDLQMPPCRKLRRSRSVQCTNPDPSLTLQNLEHPPTQQGSRNLLDQQTCTTADAQPDCQIRSGPCSDPENGCYFITLLYNTGPASLYHCH